MIRVTFERPFIKPTGHSRQLGEGVAVVVTIAGAERRRSIFHADLKPPAIQLDLMNPIGAIRWALN
jgi:hypothetical protein